MFDYLVMGMYILICLAFNTFIAMCIFVAMFAFMERRRNRKKGDDD